MTTAAELEIKKATIDDANILLDFIKQLAIYEKMLDEVSATEDLVKENIFGESSNVEALIGYYKNNPVCIAIYFFNYSTFKGKPGLYLEDLFVLPEMRGKGFGKKMLSHLASIAEAKGCARFEWAVLDWNEPAIKFYESIGAELMKEWIITRLDEDGIRRLSALNDH